MSRQERRALARQQNKQAIKAQNQTAINASTGPRTPEGKAVSSQNAFAHGLTSAKLVLPWENEGEFNLLLTQLIAEHNPATVTEGILVREIAEQYWRLARARNHEHAILSEGPRMAQQGDADIFLDWNKTATLAARYVTRHERAFHKNLNLLRTLQKERRAAEAEAQAEAENNQEAASAAADQFVSQNARSPVITTGQFVSQNTSVATPAIALDASISA